MNANNFNSFQTVRIGLLSSAAAALFLLCGPTFHDSNRHLNTKAPLAFSDSRKLNEENLTLDLEVDERKKDKEDDKKEGDDEINDGSQNEFPDTATASIDPNARLNTFLDFFEPNDASFGLTNIQEGLLLANGISARMIAMAGHKVYYANGEQSLIPFHSRPDGGDVFVDHRASNPGGWIYVSNSEMVDNNGGVGALTFDKDGNVIDYKMVLSGTTMNCNGGSTHFGAWVSCEEDFFSTNGKAYLVDPTGEREARPIFLGSDGGAFEAFAYDIRDRSKPYFYITEDVPSGPIQRYTPNVVKFSEPWDMLMEPGPVDYLLLQPSGTNSATGTFSWTTNKNAAKDNARNNYPNTEGIEISENLLFFVSKAIKALFELNLDTGVYTRTSTVNGLFEGQPDQLRNILSNHSDVNGGNGTMLYFSEDGGARAGIHAKDDEGNLYAILESPLYTPETTGLSITPDGKRLYFAFQVEGVLYELTRKDGQSFRATTMNLKTHPSEMSNVERRKRQRLYR